ncbi:MAG: triosephosphate isomerase, partial [Firmicutes bacterium]|nr:triosephosphate isomerase [Bacillota bacterium]
MCDIFVNLKRFEVPRKFGGVCPENDPILWIKNVIHSCRQLGLAKRNDIRLVFFVPEGLIYAAASSADGAFLIGSQGVFRENISPSGNFGAFTTNLPAVAAKNLGCTWSIIGHSEERQDKFGIMSAFAPEIAENPRIASKAQSAVNSLINQEVLQALQSGLNVLLCIGETAEERGVGPLTEQKKRIKKVLRTQLVEGLRGVSKYLPAREIVIGYEPIWAIGPGKTPPDRDYISFVAKLIKDLVYAEFRIPINVVYGGGLRKEN